MFGKMLNQNDQYDIAEGYYNDMDVMIPAKVWQPIDTQRIKDWDKVTDLCKTGKLTPDSKEGQGDAPFRHLWLDENGERADGPSRYVSMVPAFHNADSIGYNPDDTERPIESWAELFSEDFEGRVALLNVPQIGVMDAALAVEAMGLYQFKDKGNMTREEIDFLIDFLIEKKDNGHFRAFWESFGQSVNLMVSGEVALESMWSPAVTAIKAEGVPCVYAFPKEGMRGWHGGLAISAKTSGAQLDAAYEYINWWLDGWARCVCRAPGVLHVDTGQCQKIPRTGGMGTTGTKVNRPLRNCPIRSERLSCRRVRSATAARTGSGLENIAVWNSLMDENDYLVKRWTEFLTA